MPRFHLPPDRFDRDEPVLDGSEAAHAVRVLRLEVGNPVTLLDGHGREATAEIVEIRRHTVVLGVRERRNHPPPAPSITLIQSVLKGKAMDWLIQKATELGANRIVPVLARRSVPDFAPAEADRKRSKWEAVATETIKQCGTPWRPRIDPPRPLDCLLGSPVPADLALVGDLRPDTPPARGILDAQRARLTQSADFTLWVGPEGDFAPEELAAIRDTGAVSLSLGPRVLRSETAALSLLAIVRHLWGG